MTENKMLFVTFKVGIGFAVDDSLSQSDNVRKAIEIANEEFKDGVYLSEDDVISIEFDDITDAELEDIIKPKPKFHVIKGGKNLN